MLKHDDETKANDFWRKRSSPPEKDPKDSNPGGDENIVQGITEVNCQRVCAKTSEHSSCNTSVERCPNSVMLGCDCSYVDVKFPVKPCAQFCKSIASRCASVADKLLPLIIPGCNTSYVDPSQVDTSGARGVAVGLESWTGQRVFGEDSMQLNVVVNGTNVTADQGAVLRPCNY